MQDPRVRGGPDQQAGPGEKGVSGGHCVGRTGPVGVIPALPQPAPACPPAPPSSTASGGLPLSGHSCGEEAVGRSRFLPISEVVLVSCPPLIRCTCPSPGHDRESC